MNIQIFGTKKSADTRKAERYFKERGIKVQFVDLKEKGISKGELASVLRAAGPLENLLDPKTKDQEGLWLIRYMAEEDREAALLEHPQVLMQPIVRNGKAATAGYQPDIWKTWD